MPPRLGHWLPVYPRVCGGTGGDASLRRLDEGLSLRVRGNPPSAIPVDHRLRSIPACAGEPRPFLPANPRIAVYPRVCGGTHQRGQDIFGFVGLSPRVRGNLNAVSPDVSTSRSIPACAGEPTSSSVPSTPARVYPRVCGGTAGPMRSKSSTSGLSPRVRGNPFQLGYPRKWQGLSPRVRGNPLQPLCLHPIP